MDVVVATGTTIVEVGIDIGIDVGVDVGIEVGSGVLLPAYSKAPISNPAPSGLAFPSASDETPTSIPKSIAGEFCIRWKSEPREMDAGLAFLSPTRIPPFGAAPSVFQITLWSIVTVLAPFC